MITINGIEYRNLEEQVLENKRKIAEHYNIDRVLAEFGIRVLGTLENSIELPYSDTLQYGDAYLVGETLPYDVYVWTRANENAGHPHDYWLDIGPLSIIGPEGPRGEQGPQGIQGIDGTRWYITTNPTPPGGARVNDLWLDTSTGNIYIKLAGYWKPTNSIMGPQGIQGPVGPTGPMGLQGERGPQGQKGDIGGNFNLLGSLNNVGELPDPNTLNPHDAYIVGASRELYAQVGAEGEKVWENFGPLNVGTLVSSGGQYQNEWDADTKVPSAASYMDSSSARLYVVRSNKDTIEAARANTSSSEAGSTANINTTVYDRFLDTDVQIYKGTVMARDSNGRSSVLNPSLPKHVANKEYVDSRAASTAETKVNELAVLKSSWTPSGNVKMVYGRDSQGEATLIPQSLTGSTEAPAGTLPDEVLERYVSSIMVRDNNGRCSIIGPGHPKHIANKEYVDNTINKYKYWENTIVARTGANHIVLNLVSHGAQGLNTTSTSSLSDFPDTPCAGHIYNTNSPLLNLFPMYLRKSSGVFYLTFWNTQEDTQGTISFTTLDIQRRLSTNITMPV